MIFNRNEALEKLENRKYIDPSEDYEFGFNDGLDASMSVLEEVEELIRCKDCIYYTNLFKMEKYGACEVNLFAGVIIASPYNGFCYKGIRRKHEK